MSGGRLRWCAGAVAQAYATLGGQVVQAGKPYAAIYDRAFEVLNAVAGGVVPKERILAIGDGTATDLLGANRQGIDTLFIASGIHGDSLLDGEGVDLPRVHRALDAAGVRATYVMPRLR